MRVDNRNIEVLDNQLVELLLQKPSKTIGYYLQNLEFRKKQLTNYLCWLHPDWNDKEILGEVASGLFN